MRIVFKVFPVSTTQLFHFCFLKIKYGSIYPKYVSKLNLKTIILDFFINIIMVRNNVWFSCTLIIIVDNRYQFIILYYTLIVKRKYQLNRLFRNIFKIMNS